jgi:hypothetical protein
MARSMKPRPCMNCKELYWPLRFERCDKCYAHLRKYGRERGSNDKPTDPIHICPQCGDAKDRRADHCRKCHFILTGDNYKTHKTCRGCNQSFPIESFNWRPTAHGVPKRRSRCKECDRHSAKEARINWSPEQREHHRKKKKAYDTDIVNKPKARRWALRTNWKARGFHPDEIECLYAIKPQQCEICKRKRKLVLDHCHKSKKIRGWLCGTCNLAIGQLNDNPEYCARAAEYLRKHSKRTVAKKEVCTETQLRLGGFD